VTIPGVIAFGVFALLLLSLLRRDTDAFSPARLFGLLWSGAIGLAELKLSAYQHEWSLYSWLVFLAGIAALLLGLATAAILRPPIDFLSVAEVRARLRQHGQSKIHHKKLFWTIVILFAAYSTAYGIETVIEGTVPLFSARPDILRVSFGVFGLHLIVNAMMGIVILAVEYMLVVPASEGRRGTVGFIIFLLVASYFLLLQRYTFFVVGVIVLAMAYYTTRWVRPRNAFPFVAAFVVGLFMINQIRAARYIQEYVYYLSKMKFSKDLWFLAEPYMYIVMNLENFARAVDKLDHHFYGYFTFDWILALTGLKHWLAEYFQIERLPFLISGYNTYAFHWWYYYDFGILGVGIFPFVTGLVIGLLYSRLRTVPDPLTLVFYAASVLVIVVSYIMNPLNRLDFVSNLILLWFVHRFVIDKGEGRRYEGTGPLSVPAAGA